MLDTFTIIVTVSAGFKNIKESDQIAVYIACRVIDRISDTSLRSQITQDDEIVEIRERICKKSRTRVENGMETVNEMLREINALNEAKETKAYHEIQLIQEIYKLKNIHNN